ncbi:MAG: phosphoribosylaminoimidazolesuccinocarboxamide synthase [Planctomycetes bacterium]|nr:phosphoribosylaminoimidazolesuccinocarboxamide synthase [Planctomycetota bacterium]
MSETTGVKILREFNVPELGPVRRGKVRDVYDLGDRLLFVASDRLSAFDVVFPGGIPHKGRLLTQLSLFWFERLGVESHLISADPADLPESCAGRADDLRGRFMIVEKLRMLPVECIIRGYLAGSGWKEYQRLGTVCSIPLPAGLLESSRLPEPLFTPSTKADSGHDENISFETAASMVGEEMARRLRDRSLEVYLRASEYARTRGIIIADTKFEWGVRESTGELVLADEVLTPDSSRFWPADRYEPGRGQPSFDKQYVRDHLIATGWDQKPPAPELPPGIVQETSARYIEIYERLTGRSWE